MSGTLIDSRDLEVNERQIFLLYQDSSVPRFIWLIYTCLHNPLLLRKKNLFTHGKYTLKVLVYHDSVA